MARRARDDRIVIRDAGLLRRLRNVVDVGSERDHRLARAPARHPRGRNAGEVLLNREAVLLEDAGEVLRRLELLEPELAEAEHLIDHPLNELLLAVHLAAHVALVLIQPRIGWCGGRAGGLLRRRRYRYGHRDRARCDDYSGHMHRALQEGASVAHRGVRGQDRAALSDRQELSGRREGKTTGGAARAVPPASNTTAAASTRRCGRAWPRRARAKSSADRTSARS